MNFGLEQKEIDLIVNCITKYDEVDELYLIGSRAKGNYKYNSDIDLVIKGDIDFITFLKIKSDLEDLNLIYFIDLLNFSKITNENLKLEIQKYSKLLYKKIIKEEII